MITRLLSYGAGEGIAKGLNIALIILLPLIISPENYGVVALAVALEQILLNVFLFAQSTAVLRNYDRFRRYGNTFFRSLELAHTRFSIILFVIGCLIMLALYGYISDLASLFLILCAAPFLARLQMLQTLQRVRDLVAGYLKYRLLYQVVKFFLVLCLAVIPSLEAVSYSLGTLSSAIFTLLLFRDWGVRENKVRENKRLSKKMFLFSVPLAAQMVMNSLYSVADRYVLLYMSNKVDVAIYTFSYSIGTTLLFIANIFVIVYLPKVYREKNGLEKSIRILDGMLIRLFVLMVIAGVIVNFIIYPHMLSYYEPIYARGERVLSIAVLAVILKTFYLYGLYKLTLFRTLESIPLISAVVLSFNLCANIILIPRFGLEGAAYATLLSEALGCTLILVRSSQVCRLKAVRACE
ncbi:Uncharacterised protein [BD1-7 clade bacterium]|uniref:Polysaccharide biosynthesis protein C-terminal domain-containing protein n=1 Tax=BD1-7 clade bacterium TaxID=2029982 RepID=A0A5S9QNM1_9GAMM|nr:Uncharacterised protein [BD1-7 clade bacterium]CAA0121496.1 Uncharacterised protein [BD1-7 clade bacterium]